jgi:hypothetical protein
VKNFLKALLITLIVIILIVLIYGLITFPPIIRGMTPTQTDLHGKAALLGSLTPNLLVGFLLSVSTK